MQFLQTPRAQRLFFWLFWAVVLLSVTMAFLPKPPAMPTDRFGDKVAHILAFSAMAGLAALAYPQASRWKVIERLSFLGAIIEVVQSIPVLHRQCDVRDWIADTLAVVVVTALAAIILRLPVASAQ
ncbi:MAG: hypothetical protein ACKOPQ_00240 [Novosphingobium sp.]